MNWSDVALTGTLAAMLLAGCAANAQAAHTSNGDCVSQEACLGDDAGRLDAAALDSSSTDTRITPGLPSFLGNWSPISGSGQADCGGQLTSLPPNPSAVLGFTESGPSTLAATSSGAGGCTLSLAVDGDTAVLAQPTESCASLSGAKVSFTTFALVLTPGSGKAGSVGDAGADAVAPENDAEADAGGSAKAGNGATTLGDTLAWELVDTDGACTTTLHYTLVRTP